MTPPLADYIDDEPRCDPNHEITPRQVQRMRKDGVEFLLLDCRQPEEATIAALEDDKLIPMDVLATRMGELMGWEDKPVVVYCRTGQRSLHVTLALRELGFEDVRSMAGGIHRWADDIDPSLTKY